jgi:hypothetical protein
MNPSSDARISQNSAFGKVVRSRKAPLKRRMADDRPNTLFGLLSMLARRWRDQGKRDEAHDLLAPVYGWFTLKEVKALLDELHS